jgi:predicted DNA-binding transcriptional regulator YafY
MSFWRYRLSDLDEIAPWLLGWGTAAEVIAPRELRERLRQEARGLIEMLT